MQFRTAHLACLAGVLSFAAHAFVLSADERSEPRKHVKWGYADPDWTTDVKGWTPVEAGEHPRLVFRKADLPRLRRRADTPEGKVMIARLKKLLDGKFTLWHPGGHGLLYPNHNGDRPFNPSTITLRARTAWTKHHLTPITLHEWRHSYAAYLIAAGINTKALSTYMGHSTITITLDRYGHLLPGNEQQAAHLLDTLLTNPSTAG